MTVVTTHVAMDTISCHYKWVTFNDQLVIHAIKTKVLYQHRSFVIIIIIMVNIKLLGVRQRYLVLKCVYNVTC